VSFATNVLCSLPWVLPLLVTVIRARNSRSLDEVSPDVEADAASVTVVIPARNEARNIDRCVRSVLASRYPAFDVVVIDDHSTDGTGDIARIVAPLDPRLRVIAAPELPAGWFGKQWACASGAALTNSDLLLFTDADTAHGPELLPRAVNAMRGRGADLLTVSGHQETHSFWERVLQPQIFSLLAARFGGTEHVNTARRAEDVIANGQYILTTRAAYDAVGGHHGVRDVVAEDLALAQRYFRAGKRVIVVLAIEHLSTRMYTSLREIVAGWRKNIFAGGRYAMPAGAVGRVLFPVAVVGVPLFNLAPVVALGLAAAGVLAHAWLVWSSIVVSVTVLFWIAVYAFIGEPIWYALLYPLGLALLEYIVVGSVLRGNRVAWKERTYLSR